MTYEEAYEEAVTAAKENSCRMFVVKTPMDYGDITFDAVTEFQIEHSRWFVESTIFDTIGPDGTEEE